MTAPQAKRKWCQFSLLSLLVMMTLAAGGAGIWAYQLNRFRERDAARSRVAETINTYSGYISDGSDLSFGNSLKGEALKTFLDDLQCWEELRCLHFEQSGVNDQNMKQLGKLRNLVFLKLR